MDEFIFIFIFIGKDKAFLEQRLVCQGLEKLVDVCFSILDIFDYL